MQTNSITCNNGENQNFVNRVLLSEEKVSPKPILCALCNVHNSQFRNEIEAIYTSVANNANFDGSNAQDREFRLQFKDDRVSVLEKGILSRANSGFEGTNKAVISSDYIRKRQIALQKPNEKEAAEKIEGLLKSFKSSGNMDLKEKPLQSLQLKQPIADMKYYYTRAKKWSNEAATSLKLHQEYLEHIEGKTCFNTRIKQITSCDISPTLKSELVKGWESLNESVYKDTHETVKVLEGLSGTPKHIDRLNIFSDVLENNYGLQSQHIQSMTLNK